ncbi:PopZ family protein [Aquamicrobium terrae]
MATASSVQREPSMEEILASIRRIIEDSDSGRKPTEAFGETGTEAETAEGPEPTVVDVFRSELRSGTEDAPVKPSVTEPLGTASTAPGAALSLAANSPEEKSKESVSPASASAPAFTRIDFTRPDSTRPAAEQTARPLRTPDDWHVPVEVAEAEPAETKAQADQAMALAAAMPSRSAAASTERTAGETASPDIPAAMHDPATAGEATDAAAARPTLVSEKTSRQVAAAFEELSEAFAARSKKSLDEMAEEMLRPMLQEWLDNNLPTLVERLVREEIERVARGT